MSVDLGLLILRVVVGLLFVGHGAQKLFGWFGGHGLTGTAGWLESQGMQPARLWALMAGVGELVGGMLFALGLFGPVGGVAIAAAMFVAIVKVHARNGLWATQNGFEYPLVLLVLALVIAATGPGAYSLDQMLGIALPMPLTFWLVVIAALTVTSAGFMLPAEPPFRQARQSS